MSTHLVRTITAGVSPRDVPSCGHRTVWGILAGCAFTLLICVWYTVHPSLPLPHYKRAHVILFRFWLMIVTIIAPEGMLTVAFLEWLEAQRMTKRVSKNYKWWTMTHSHLMLIGGFALRDDAGIREIGIDEFLQLVDAGDILDPAIRENVIKDKSTSDGLGIVVLSLQLSWFTTQIVARLVNRLAVTLVELEAWCIALLTIPLFYCWRQKPRFPQYPHIFYRRNLNDPSSLDISQDDDDSEKLLQNPTIKTTRNDFLFIAHSEVVLEYVVPCCLAWAVFGSLQAIAWNYKFPTVSEKIVWRVSSLVLAGSPLVLVVGSIIMADVHRVLTVWTCMFFAMGFISRILSIALMLSSLRSLPGSVYLTIPWSDFIPHITF